MGFWKILVKNISVFIVFVVVGVVGVVVLVNVCVCYCFAIAFCRRWGCCCCWCRRGARGCGFCCRGQVLKVNVVGTLFLKTLREFCFVSSVIC